MRKRYTHLLSMVLFVGLFVTFAVPGFGFLPFPPLPLPFPWFPPAQSVTIINNVVTDGAKGTAAEGVQEKLNLKILEMLDKILDRLDKLEGKASGTADISSGTTDVSDGCDSCSPPDVPCTCSGTADVTEEREYPEWFDSENPPEEPIEPPYIAEPGPNGTPADVEAIKANHQLWEEYNAEKAEYDKKKEEWDELKKQWDDDKEKEAETVEEPVVEDDADSILNE